VLGTRNEIERGAMSVKAGENGESLEFHLCLCFSRAGGKMPTCVMKSINVALTVSQARNLEAGLFEISFLFFFEKALVDG
jgi:hypothetical protein